MYKKTILSQNSPEKEFASDELFRVELSDTAPYSHDLPIDNSTYVVTRVSLYVVGTCNSVVSSSKLHYVF